MNAVTESDSMAMKTTMKLGGIEIGATRGSPK
jgi:hypothetical protein